MSQRPSSQVGDPPLHLPASPSLSHSVTLPSVRSRRAHLPQAPHQHSEVRHTRVPTPPTPQGSDASKQGCTWSSLCSFGQQLISRRVSGAASILSVGSHRRHQNDPDRAQTVIGSERRKAKVSLERLLSMKSLSVGSHRRHKHPESTACPACDVPLISTI